MKLKYNLQSPEDWNNIITQNNIVENGGSSLLSKYSLNTLKCIICPEGKLFFNPEKKSSGYWNDKKNIIQYLEMLKLYT